jgi:hypothetical protein
MKPLNRNKDSKRVSFWESLGVSLNVVSFLSFATTLGVVIFLAFAIFLSMSKGHIDWALVILTIFIILQGVLLQSKISSASKKLTKSK